MSNKLPTRPPKLHAVSAPRFAIVASEYNPEFVQGLINNTCKELYKIDPNSAVELFGAPGSFEIPVVAEMVAANRKCDVVIALGLILQGQTKHAEFIALSVGHALQQVALKHTLPVIHEVLLVSSEEEARERCLGRELNRGIEAARAAFAMLRVKEKFKPPASLR
jgi:6,7-dimethyl-8-ribityllumazine synthase